MEQQRQPSENARNQHDLAFRTDLADHVKTAFRAKNTVREIAKEVSVREAPSQLPVRSVGGQSVRRRHAQATMLEVGWSGLSDDEREVLS